MIERPLTFGAGDGLVGTTCTPAAPGASRVGMILFNSGVIHRVGPHRLNVRIARKLAAQGIPSLRFDLAGLGDSARPGGELAFQAQAVADLRAAMNALGAAAAVDRFALFGFCSGAYHGYATALADERVAGLLMYDAYLYPTPRALARRYLMRIRQRGWLASLASWGKQAITWPVRRMKAALRGASGPQRVSDVGFFTENPPKAEFAANLRKLLDRKVGISLIYSGGGFDQYNYADQFRDAFGRFGIAEQVRTEIIPDLDHVATGIAAQAVLVERIVEWAKGL